MFEQLQASLSACRPNKDRYTVDCDESGILQISITSNIESKVRVTWNQIAAVYAYKKDFFSVDQIRIVLIGPSSQVLIEITEDDSGYENLILYIPKYLDGFPSREKWRETVAFPPFATQWTCLYNRQDTAK